MPDFIEHIKDIMRHTLGWTTGCIVVMVILRYLVSKIPKDRT